MPSTSIESAAIDGRARAPRFIQRQLANLYKAISGNATELQDTIIADTGANLRDAQLEVYLTVSVVKDLYDDFSVDDFLLREYRIARGEDWLDRRDAVGIVHLRAQAHNLLYSIVAPLANAIAAGNCVVVELNTVHQSLSSLTRRILLEYLDRDTLAFVDELPEPGDRTLVLDQTGDQTRDGLQRTTVAIRAPNASARVVALVDRSADIESAARSIVQARVAFGGRSRYAPNIILVNEFIVKDFTDAAKIAMCERIDNMRAFQNANSEIGGMDGEVDNLLSSEEIRDPGLNVVVHGDIGTIITIDNRKSSLLQRDRGAALIVHSIRSLDDGIDFANSSAGTLLACYHFGALEATKYTTQFVDSYMSFVNHIPIELSVGPAAPLAFQPSATHRYRPEMFSIPKADYVAESSVARKLFDEVVIIKEAAWARTYEQRISTRLAPTGQRPGKVVGFFDQGLITGLVVFWVPVFSLVVAGSAFGVRAGLKIMKSSL